MCVCARVCEHVLSVLLCGVGGGGGRGSCYFVQIAVLLILFACMFAGLLSSRLLFYQLVFFFKSSVFSPKL